MRKIYLLVSFLGIGYIGYFMKSFLLEFFYVWLNIGYNKLGRKNYEKIIYIRSFSCFFVK